MDPILPGPNVPKTRDAKIMEDAIKGKIATKLPGVSSLCIVQARSRTGLGWPVKAP